MNTNIAFGGMCFHKLYAVHGIMNTNIAFCSLCFHKLYAVRGIMNTNFAFGGMCFHKLCAACGIVNTYIAFCSIPDTISALKMYVRWCRVWSVQRSPLNVPEIRGSLVSIVTGYRLTGAKVLCHHIETSTCQCNGCQSPHPQFIKFLAQGSELSLGAIAKNGMFRDS